MCVLRFSYAMMEVTDGSTGVLLLMLVNSAAACKPKHHDALNASALHSMSICHICHVTQPLQRSCRNGCQTLKQMQQAAFTIKMVKAAERLCLLAAGFLCSTQASTT